MYTNFNPLTDQPIDMPELSFALRNVGKGIGLDGIPPMVATLFPSSLQKSLQSLLHRIFDVGGYPNEWQMQLLLSLPKNKHSCSSTITRNSYFVVITTYLRQHDRSKTVVMV